MNGSKNNIIQKQVLDITIPGKDGVYLLQNTMSALYHERLTGIIDRACSSLSPAGEHIRLGKVEIDLGSLPLTGVEEEFVQRLDKALSEALIARISSLQQDLDGGGSSLLEKEDEEGIYDARHFNTELLRYFLRTGALPWWAEENMVFCLNTFLNNLIDKYPDTTRDVLALEMRHDAPRRRLIYQLEKNTLTRVAALGRSGNLDIITRAKEWISDLHALSELTPSNSISKEDIRLSVWENALRASFIGSKEDEEEKNILRSILASISERNNKDYKDILKNFHQSLPRLHNLARRPLNRLTHIITLLFLGEEGDKDSGSSLTPAPENLRNGGTAFKKDPARHFDLSLNPRGLNNNREVEAYSRDDHTEGEGSITVAERSSSLTTTGLREDQAHSSPLDDVTLQGCNATNAGLFLLWPYLKIFFTELKLMREGQFVDEPSRVRAIHILHYLATGEENPEEAMLLVHKILCGLHVLRPLGKKYSLSREVKQESEALLRTVITHWSALKNTSIKGFRDSFLQRRGRLKKQDGSWLLQIERRGYDMLLDYIPWNISIIKTSWMRTILYVQW